MKIVIKKYYYFRHGWRLEIHSLSSNISFLNEDEVFYLANEISKIYKGKSDRLKTLKQQRSNRDNEKKRKQMCDVYCKGDKQ